MKKLVLFILLFTIYSSPSTVLLAQNLVPNPSFEQYTACPNFQCQIYRATGWQSFGYTPDYFNACSLIQNYSVPQNGVGYQYAATGNAYAGIGTYYSTNNVREYIGIQLINSLTINQTYYVSFKANFTLFININCATNKLGVLFSTVSYALDTLCSPTTLLLPQNNAQVYDDSIITDTANWTLVSGSFVADSAYKYIIIGNFFDNAHTDTIMYNTTYPSVSYYFIDDIYVGENPDVINENYIKKNIDVFPNPVENTFYYTKSFLHPVNFYLFNITGQCVYKQQFIEYHQQAIILPALQNGMYFFKVSDEKTFNKINKLIIQKN